MARKDTALPEDHAVTRWHFLYANELLRWIAIVAYSRRGLPLSFWHIARHSTFQSEMKLKLGMVHSVSCVVCCPNGWW